MFVNSWTETVSEIEFGGVNDPLRREVILEAKRVLTPILTPTPLIYSEFFSDTSGYEVYLKPENLQVTGAYKIRGASYRIACLTDVEKEKPLIAASAGNHAQGVAYAARHRGLKACICMPLTTPLVKVNRTRSLGAEVILVGESFNEAYDEAVRLANTGEYTFIHPFDDLTVAAGQGTVGVEIMNELIDCDAVLVPIGGGGLATGIASYIKQISPKTKVIGIEPQGGACCIEALVAGAPIDIGPVDTIADGVAVRLIGSKIFPYLSHYLDGVITVDDEELAPVFLDVMESHKLVVENAGLLSLAALRKLKRMPELGVKLGSKVVCILSGGNMDVLTIAMQVRYGLIARHRIFTFEVKVPDKPGSLAKILQVVAITRGNVIKLEHNQFVSINRQRGVLLKATLETFGKEHQEQIVKVLQDSGYDVTVAKTEDNFL